MMIPNTGLLFGPPCLTFGLLWDCCHDCCLIFLSIN